MGKQSNNITYVSQDQFNKDLDESLNILIEDGADDKTIKLYIDDYKSRFAVKKKDGTKPNSTSTSASQKQVSVQKNGSSVSNVPDIIAKNNEKARSVPKGTSFKLPEEKGKPNPNINYDNYDLEQNSAAVEKKAPKSKNYTVASTAYNYALNNVDKSLSEQRYKDEVDNYQFFDGIKQGMKNTFNTFIGNPLTKLNESLGGNKDFTISQYKPLESELKQAKKELFDERGNNKFTEEEIQERAKKIFIDKDIQEQLHSNIDKALPFGYDREGIWKELKLEQLRSNDILREKVASAEVFKSKIEEFKEFSKNINRENPTEQDIEKFNTLKEEALTAVDGLNYLSKNYDKYVDLAKTDEEKLELFKYNYNDFEKNAKLFYSSALNIEGGTLKLLGETAKYVDNELGLAPIAGQMMSDLGSEMMNDAKKESEPFYRYKATKLNSFSDFGSFAAQLTSEQLPILATIYLGGTTGVAATSMSSGGQKINDLENEPGKKYSDGEKLATGWLYAGAEFFPEKIGTARILKDLERTVSSASTQSRKLFRDNFLKETIKGTQKLAYYSGLEGSTELVTAQGQITIDEELLNIVKTDAENNEQRMESFFSGAVMGGGMSVVGGGLGFVTAQAKLYSEAKDVKEVKSILSNVQGIQNEIETNVLLTDKERTELYQEMNVLTNQAFETIAKNANKATEFSVEEKSTLLDINLRQAELKSKYQEIADSNFSKEIKNKKVQELESEYNSLEEKRNSVLKGEFNTTKQDAVQQEATTTETKQEAQPQAEVKAEVGEVNQKILDLEQKRDAEIEALKEKRLYDTKYIEPIREKYNNLILEEKSKGFDLFHTGNEGLSIESVSVDPRVTRQGKKGKYGGFYTYDNIGNIISFLKGNKTSTVYGIKLNDGVEITDYNGSVERLNAEKLQELRDSGVKVIRGKSIVGKTEIIVVDKSAIKSIEKINETAPSQVDNVDGNVQPGNNVVEPSGTTEQENNQASNIQPADNIENVERKNEPKVDTSGIGTENYKQRKSQIKGRKREITIADGSKVKGQYKVVSSDDILASHNEENFSKTEGYPVNERGETINDRDYERDKNAQAEVSKIAQDYDGRAIQQTPIVTKEGIVVDGNNRVMSRKLAAKKGTDTKYKEALFNEADMYGINPDEISKVKNPIIVFEAENEMPYNTETLAKFNKQDKKEKSSSGKAVELSKTLNDKAKRQIAEVYDTAERPSDVTSDPKSVKQLRDILLNNGIIQSNEIPRYFDVDKGVMTKEGVSLMENIALGSVFKEKTINTLSLQGMGDIRNKILQSLVGLINNSSLAEAHQLGGELSNAIEVIYQLKTTKQTIDEYLDQPDIFGEKLTPNIDEYAVLLALSDAGFKKWLQNYNNNVGQPDIFKIEDNGITTKRDKSNETITDKRKQIPTNLRGDAKGNEAENGQPNGEIAGEIEKKSSDRKNDKGTKGERQVKSEEVTPEEKPSLLDEKIEKDKLSDVLDWLDGLKLDPNDLNATLPFLPQSWNMFIEAVKLAVKAGKTINDAIKEAIKKLQSEGIGNDEINAIVEKFTGQATKKAESGTFERKEGKKSLLSRVYEGENKEPLNSIIEDIGLDYKVENQEQAQNRAKKFVKLVGINKALEAVRNNLIKGAEKAFVYAEILDQIVELSESANIDEIGKIQEDYNVILEESLNAFDEEARDAGRFISALNKIYNNSRVRYNLTKQINQYKALNKGVIDEETLIKFNEADRKLKEIEQKLKEAEAKLMEQEQQLAIKNIEEAIAREIKNKVSNKTKATKIANQIRRAKINRPDVFNAVTPASLVWDTAVEIVATTLQDTKIGNNLAVAIQKGVEYIKNTDWYKNATKDTQKKAIDSFTERMVSDSIEQTSSISISDDGKIRIPESVVKDYVRQGITDINEISQRIIDDFFSGNEDVTVREVRDAITRYGKTINQSKDEINAKVRELKRLGKLISAMEDVLEGKRPLKSGLQRDKPTQVEREMMRELKDKMRDLPLDEADLEIAWKNALDTYKQRLKNQIEDLEKQIENKEKSKVKRESVKLDEEAKALKEQVKVLRETLNNLVGKPELTEEQKINRATRQLENAIDNLTNQIANGELDYKDKPTPVNSARLTELRKQKDDLNKQLQKAREESGIVEKRRLKQAKQRLKNQIELYQKKIQNKDFSKKEPKPLPADVELQQLQAEKIKWQEVYDKAKYEAELRDRKWQDYARELLVGIIGLPRLLMAGGEMSMVFIQGGIQTISLATRNPKILAQIFAKAFISIGSNEKFLEYERAIKSDPNYMLMKNSKLALTETDYQMELREETFIGSNIVYGTWNAIGKGIEIGTVKILGKKDFPTIGSTFVSMIKKDIETKKIPISEQFKNINPLLAFERGNTIYMNEIRKARFMDGVKMLKMEGKNENDHKEDFKILAKAINTLTGRTSIGRLENINDYLGIIFFSFKNTISVFQQLNPWFYSYVLRNNYDEWTKPSVAQKIAVKDMVTFVTITTSMMFLLQAAAGEDDEGNPVVEIEKDPRSSDFMTLKIKGKDKDTRFDPWHGMKPQVVLFARLITGEQKRFKKGKVEIKRIGLGYKADTHWDNITKAYVYNKFSPSMQMAYKQMDSEVDKDGNKTYYGKDFQERFSLTPMYIESLREIEKQDPDTFTRFLAALGFFGLNSSTY